MNHADAGFDADPRCTELETLEAIYPEMRQSQNPGLGASGIESRFCFELELPVEPAQPVTVVFPAASSASHAPRDERAPVGEGSAAAAAGLAETGASAEPLDSLLVSHLPPLSLRFTLPDGYPYEKPPQVAISTTPPWLASRTLRALEDDGPRLWEEAGRDMVAFTYIDHVQREADNVFGMIGSGGALEVDSEHKLAVLDFDMNAKKAAFEKETFECGICLDPKKGSRCHRMMDCGHIFCLGCLQDFYANAIKEGVLAAVRCAAPQCARERASDSAAKAKSPSKAAISPSELLQIGLSEDMVKRYVTLKYKTELEADKDTVYCPRQWCNGAARSKRHKKPEGLQFAQSSGGDDGQDDDGGGDGGDGDDAEHGDGIDERAAGQRKQKEGQKKFDPADLLCICEECGFAFCSRCLQTWHGEFVRCAPKRNGDELSEEEKASLEYMQLHTSPCPTCNAPAQKTHGCNHMICSRCDTHFCYLCSSWLDPGNPYKHYNQQADGKVTSCYMRLWELEGGDGDDVGLGFVGGGGPRGGEAGGGDGDGDGEGDGNGNGNGNGNGEVDGHGDDDEADVADNSADEDAEQPNANVAAALEAPLVLRLMGNQARRGQQGPGGRRRGDGARERGQRAPPARAQGQQQQQQQQQQQRRRLRRRRGQRAAGGAARGPQGHPAGQQPAQPDGGGLDAAQEAWVRRFVRMALVDAEDQVPGGESDSDDGNWRIR
ncbi:uncharacterized protein UV8b_03075 [Ustilaginoidea virens]|uniref:RBR-type E3 ubiquitin transferase n=1 Tax=Ustilaginoidea virens TaxID=1159556 RepID=A0A063C6D5_USTVR|nr:uncharacterized protein UV8b_03075 [Ustilaginoidea virens]QUC18834.1 hypothetical protein UV8b_03075 [Ustilaginoidea virens]GAO15802.1 hypothetical protein UVI_02021340 [Ustilaginoidea virens]